MDKMDAHFVDNATIHAVLEGGPSDIPETLRSRREPAGTPKIKIPHRGGYEHFECDGDISTVDNTTPLVYRWTERTKIAE
jgi:hypothetical protein